MKTFIALFALVAVVYAEAEAEAQYMGAAQFGGAPVARKPNGFYYHVQTYDNTPANTQLLQRPVAPVDAVTAEQQVAAVPNLYNNAGLYHPYQAAAAYNPYGAWNGAGYAGYAGYGRAGAYPGYAGYAGAGYAGAAYGAYPYGQNYGAWNNRAYAGYPYGGQYNNWYNAPRAVASAAVAPATSA